LIFARLSEGSERGKNILGHSAECSFEPMSTSEVNVAGTPIVISGREEFCFKVKYRIGIFPFLTNTDCVRAEFGICVFA